MILDFLIGVLIMNALPHFVLGIAKMRFLGLFGYKPNANIWYAVVQFVIALVLFHIRYGIAAVLENGIFLGAVCTCLLFLIFGKVLLKFYQKK